MVRSSSPLLLLSTLFLGVLLGLNLDRGQRVVSAQARPPASPAEDVGPVAIPSSTPTRVAGGEDAVYAQLARQYAQFEHVNRTFELVSRAISPSVVHLVAHKVGRREEEPRATEYEETGSGVIVRSEGTRGLFVLTNNHVVANASVGQIDIFLSDGRSFHPTRVFADSKADIAVLRLDRTDLPAARLGNSDDAAVGSWVLAMGSPFGLNHSVSQGIISGRGRHEVDLERAGVENQDFLQTDAAINPGNSGGPLVNMKGEVVGINIAILSNGGGNEGVGFSIPINLAKWIMSQLLANGRVNRGALGVKLHPEFVTETAISLGLDRPKGAWIESVDPQSPAAVGGLKVGDVVLRFNNAEVTDLNHLINLVSMAPIGQAADVVLWRDRREVTVRVMVADKDRIVGQPRPGRALPHSGTIKGLEMVTLDAPVARRMGLPEEFRGAAVMKVEPDSPLAGYFRPLDVISSVAGRPIQSADEVIQALGARRAAPAGLELDIHRLVDGAFQLSRGPRALMPALFEALAVLGSGTGLTADQSKAAVAEIMTGEAPDGLVGAFLAALRVKGESAEELAGAVEAVRDRMTPWAPIEGLPATLDTCGTGGDGANTINISTASAVVVAASGVPVAKHGNRSASGNSGSAEVLAELGVDVEAGPELVRRSLAELGLTFLFAPKFHPALRFAAPIRRQLPFRTLFNMVGPLANPARPAYQLIGVPDNRLAHLMAAAIARLGVVRAAVVTGSDGLDEVSLDGPTRVRWVESGSVSLRTWSLDDFGLAPVRAESLRVSGPAESASKLRQLFEGAPGPARDTVLANAAAALLVAGRVATLREGVELASRAIDEGTAASLLDRWSRLTRGI